MRRVVVVRNALAVVAVEAVEALFERLTVRSRSAESPLPKRARHVALPLQERRQGDRISRHRKLAFPFKLEIVTDKRMARMLSRHQHTARGCAHVIAGIMLSETHALSGHAVNVRGADLLLAI